MKLSPRACRRRSRSPKGVWPPPRNYDSAACSRPQGGLYPSVASTQLSPFRNPVAMDPTWTSSRSAMTAYDQSRSSCIRIRARATTRLGTHRLQGSRLQFTCQGDIRWLQKRKDFREARPESCFVHSSDPVWKLR